MPLPAPALQAPKVARVGILAGGGPSFHTGFEPFRQRLRDRVELYNDRGTFGVTLEVSDEVAPGIALVTGQRPSGEAHQGTVNLLCSDRYSDLGEGATYQSTFLDVRRASLL